MGLFDVLSVNDERFEINDNRANNGGLNPHLFLAGQVVSGVYKFAVTSELSFRSISLKMSCREHTAYKNGKHMRYESRNLLKSYIVLLGMCKRTRLEKQEGKESSAHKDWSATLPIGEYCFPFAFRLPMDAPPTAFVMMSRVFTCSVEYQLKAHFDIPFGADKTTKINFAVQQPMPAGQHQASISAGQFSIGPLAAKRVCCYCCDRGTTEVSMTIDKRAVLFGTDNSVRGVITVDNTNSSASLNEVEIAFVERGVFGVRSCTHMVRTVRKLTAKSYPVMGGGSKQTVEFELDLSRLSANQQFPLRDQYPHKDLPATRANTRFDTYDAPTGLANSYSGVSMTLYYCVEASCGGDVLASIVVPCASFVDPSNSCAPIAISQSGAINQRQQIPQFGFYNKYAYAPPPHTISPGNTSGMNFVLSKAVLESRGAFGPLNSASPLPPLPYVNGAHETVPVLVVPFGGAVVNNNEAATVGFFGSAAAQASLPPPPHGGNVVVYDGDGSANGLPPPPRGVAGHPNANEDLL